MQDSTLARAGLPEPRLSKPHPPFASIRSLRFWAACGLGYTLFVILFGAVVRITGSGAGCGQHWPTCHGEIVHLPGRLETLIELSHRITSGISFIAVMALYVVARRRYRPGHLALRAARYSAVFMIVEVLIGALLVLARLVGDNDSISRAAVMAAHLVNTCFLTASLLALVWAARFEHIARRRPPPALELELKIAASGVLLICLTGAITALGDTLYPPQAVGRLLTFPTASTHFLTELRVYHPVIAVIVSIYLWSVAVRAPKLAPLFASPARETTGREKPARECSEGEAPAAPELATAARLLTVTLAVQLGAGVLNVLLSAPGYMQVAHLALALAVWLALIWLILHVRYRGHATAAA